MANMKDFQYEDLSVYGSSYHTLADIYLPFLSHQTYPKSSNWIIQVYMSLGPKRGVLPMGLIQIMFYFVLPHSAQSS